MNGEFTFSVFDTITSEDVDRFVPDPEAVKKVVLELYVAQNLYSLVAILETNLLISFEGQYDGLDAENVKLLRRKVNNAIREKALRVKNLSLKTSICFPMKIVRFIKSIPPNPAPETKTLDAECNSLDSSNAQASQTDTQPDDSDKENFLVKQPKRRRFSFPCECLGPKKRVPRYNENGSIEFPGCTFATFEGKCAYCSTRPANESSVGAILKNRFETRNRPIRPVYIDFEGGLRKLRELSILETGPDVNKITTLNFEVSNFNDWEFRSDEFISTYFIKLFREIIENEPDAMIVLIAHNGNSFDFRLLFEYLKKSKQPISDILESIYVADSMISMWFAYLADVEDERVNKKSHAIDYLLPLFGKEGRGETVHSSAYDVVLLEFLFRSVFSKNEFAALRSFSVSFSDWAKFTLGSDAAVDLK